MSSIDRNVADFDREGFFLFCESKLDEKLFMDQSVCFVCFFHLFQSSGSQESAVKTWSSS